MTSTTFAWARALSDVSVTLSPDGENTSFAFAGNYSTGRDIRTLAKAISADVHSGKKIAVGLEAPMWQPAPTNCGDSQFELFRIRFPQERGCAWYLQSGAAATLKALSIGRLLFELSEVSKNQLRCSTEPCVEANIELFEGFVVGKWKLPSERLSRAESHAWDALTTAVAYHYSNRLPSEAAASPVVHPAKSNSLPVISHWQTILNAASVDSSRCSADCLVVGFNSECPIVCSLARHHHQQAHARTRQKVRSRVSRGNPEEV